MPRTLTHSLTSDYLDASRVLSPRKRRRRIVAFVESYDDIAFWRTLLSRFENDERYFDVMLPVAKDLTHGKKSVLLSCFEGDQLGKSLIACVDSDYDFLLQRATATSRKLIDNPYVFQTYCYAIENYRCYARCLHNVCVKSTLNDHKIFDFEAYMERYSEIVYPLFLWNLFFYRQLDTHTYPMKRFNETTIIRNVDVRYPQLSLDKLSLDVHKAIKSWENRYPQYVDEVTAQRELFAKLGLTPKTTYLYMQGHHIYDNVVMRLLIPVCTQLRREREDFIKRKAVHSEQLSNELTGYENSAAPVDEILRRMDGFEDLFLFRWILEDLSNVFPKEQ